MKRRIFLALFVLILCPIVFGLLSQAFPKRYTSSMGLLVDQTIRTIDQSGPFSAIDDIINFQRARSVQTQLEIITGSTVLSKAIEKITPQFPGEFPDAETRQEKIEKLIARLRVDVSKESDVITLRVTSEKPELSAAMANEIGNAFIEESKTWAAQSGNAAITALDNQIKGAKTVLDRVDGEVQTLKSGLGVADPQTAAAGDSSTLSALQLRQSNIDGELAGTRSELREQQSILAGMKKEIVLSQGDQLDPEWSETLVQLARAKALLEGARSRYLDDHPAVQEYLLQVQSWEREKERLKGKTIIRINEQRGPNPLYNNQLQTVNVLRGREKSLSNQAAEVSSDITTIQTRLKEYAGLEKKLASLLRDRTVYEQTYLQLVQRRSTLEAMDGGRKSMATIVSPAYPLNRPSFPDVRLFTFMGIGLGIVLFALIVMPKAPTETYIPVVGPERTALSSEKKKKLSSGDETSALGEGPKSE